MRDYLENPDWEKRIRWDRALYFAANASFDMTIEDLGREKVASHMTEFQEAQQEVQTRCFPRAKLPCTADWTR